MSLPCRNNILLPWMLGLLLLQAGMTRAADADTLRVCADPNNLPFSNEQQEGFENALAELVGEALGKPVAYTWYPQRRGFVRYTLKAGKCDLIMGVPVGYELAQPTSPYYRSTYVFVTRRSDDLQLTGLDDPRLRTLRIGVPVVGDDYSSTPGAMALGRRGIIDNLVGYSVYGDYSEPNPPSRLIEAVANGDVDVAIAWGPLAGYFADRQSVPLNVVPVTPEVDGDTPFTFSIAMAVRRNDEAFRQEIEQVLRARAPMIRALLADYHVPMLDLENASDRATEGTDHVEDRSAAVRRTGKHSADQQ